MYGVGNSRYDSKQGGMVGGRRRRGKEEKQEEEEGETTQWLDRWLNPITFWPPYLRNTRACIRTHERLKACRTALAFEILIQRKKTKEHHKITTYRVWRCLRSLKWFGGIFLILLNRRSLGRRERDDKQFSVMTWSGGGFTHTFPQTPRTKTYWEMNQHLHLGILYPFFFLLFLLKQY